MRVLLLCGEETATAGVFRELLKKEALDTENSILKSGEELFSVLCGSPSGDVKTGPEKTVIIPSHILILSPVSPSWLGFIAGFACGAGLPLLVYGDETAGRIPREFAGCFRVFKTESQLMDYFRSEKQARQKRETAREAARARETLLHMGVPVSADSLAACTSEGHLREVALFLAAGFSPDSQDRFGVPLLHLAVRGGHRETALLLLEAGAQVNLRSKDRGSSALIDCAMGKFHDIAADLLHAGADVNIKSKDGQSALILAVGSGDETMTEMLLKAGADPDDPDVLGASARKYASLFNKSGIIALFKTYAVSRTGCYGY
jgi:hypothetical protein